MQANIDRTCMHQRPLGATASCAVVAASAGPHPAQRHVQRRQRHGCHGCRGRQAQQQPRAFMGSLDLVPGWLMPSWMAPEPSGPRDEVRQQRLRMLRHLLKASSRAPALPLPPPPGEDGAMPPADDVGAGAGALDITHSASNAVPFTAGGGAAPSSLTVALNGGASSVCRAEEVCTVLPWLFAAEGRLDFSAMEHLASQLALSGLQLLDVGRFAAAASSSNGHWHSSWGSHVRWAGPTALPSPAVAAAAALRRMEVRRGGALRGLPEVEGKAVSLLTAGVGCAVVCCQGAVDAAVLTDQVAWAGDGGVRREELLAGPSRPAWAQLASSECLLPG